MISKVLFITLSNFGDVVLTLPALDVLRQEFPKARITVMVGPRVAGIFENNPFIHKLIIYDKYACLKEKIRLFFQLKKERFDLVVDFRNTLYGALLPAVCRTSPFLYIPTGIRHMNERNLYRLAKALGHKGAWQKAEDKSFYVSQENKNYISAVLENNGIGSADKLIIVSPITAGSAKQWDKQNFIQLCGQLKDYKLLLIGRQEDKSVIEQICLQAEASILNLAGRTSLEQLAYLLQKACLVVSCDTGILHLASYFDVPILGIYGPTDERKYGPWSSKYKVLKSSVSCRPCMRPNCKFNTSDCMRQISVKQALDSIDALLKS